MFTIIKQQLKLIINCYFVQNMIIFISPTNGRQGKQSEREK